MKRQRDNRRISFGKASGLKRWAAILAGTLALFVAAFFAYASAYYHADERARTFMQSDEAVSIAKTDYGWLFDGPAEDVALIFYPGAKVEETAYAPLLHALAAQGMDVCLVKMPLRFAFFNPWIAGIVQRAHDYREWYIGGHSLGGAMAAWYAADHANDFAGTILLASYPIKKLPEPLTEIQLVGSEDQVISWSRVEAYRAFAPKEYHEHIIEGGNHAQFGSYGVQRGDGRATISGEEQVRETCRYILKRRG